MSAHFILILIVHTNFWSGLELYVINTHVFLKLFKLSDAFNAFLHTQNRIPWSQTSYPDKLQPNPIEGPQAKSRKIGNSQKGIPKARRPRSLLPRQE